jgi:hypothetical protein
MSRNWCFAPSGLVFIPFLNVDCLSEMVARGQRDKIGLSSGSKTLNGPLNFSSAYCRPIGYCHAELISNFHV